MDLLKRIWYLTCSTLGLELSYSREDRQLLAAKCSSRLSNCQHSKPPEYRLTVEDQNLCWTLHVEPASGSGLLSRLAITAQREGTM